jgi:hypothetical protein
MLVFLFYIAFCVLVGWFGSKRRFGFWGHFFVSLIFTPIVGLLLVIASDPSKQPSQMNKIVGHLDELKWYVVKFQSVGLTAQETKELVDRINTLQKAIIYNTI